MWSRYLAMGDSASEGVGDDVDGLACRSWTELFAEQLAESGAPLEYRNVALRGSVTADVLRDQAPVLETFRPDLVSVTVGANDARVNEWTPKAFADDFSTLLAAIRATGAMTLTATYADIRGLIEFSRHTIPDSWRMYFERMQQVNRVIREVSARFGARVVEMEHSEASTDSSYISRDFTHPNALGYQLIARHALDAVADLVPTGEVAARQAGE